MSTTTAPVTTAPSPQVNVACKICTIRLERLCYQRAWWFRSFREVLATGIRLFALVYRIRPDDYKTRSPECYHCIRFKKNALKKQSAVFEWLDSWLNPMFNRARDSLLTQDELDEARRFAVEAERPAMQLPSEELSPG
jgi:hypothetical protein